jgi:acetyl-CoA carboxylase biotin carboxyl carrier protein
MAEIQILSELNASIWKIPVNAGDQVEADQQLAILQSMKTEIPATWPSPGRVARILVVEAELISEGQTLLLLQT